MERCETMFGFYRLAAVVPELRVADVDFNLSKLAEGYEKAAKAGAAAVVFPELCITGYSCGDLFFQRRLLDRASEAAVEFAALTAGRGTVAIFGLPLLHEDALYNVAAVAQGGELRGLVPKTLLPNYREFYEKRHFRSGRGIVGACVSFGTRSLPFGTDLLFDCGGGFRSARCLAAYVLASAGVHESTTDVVFGGHALIADNGRLAAENRRFARKGSLLLADVDFDRLGAARLSESSFHDNPLPEGKRFRTIPLDRVEGSPDFAFAYNPPRPFVPGDVEHRRERCTEIFDIQCAGLAKRVEHTGAKKLVIGISGGLDSTLALLVAAECCRLIGRPASDIVALTMPGFGTTGRTRGNAVKLCELLGVTLREVDIRPACLRHFEDIGHDPAKLDTAYENVQARERTQILMDIANEAGGMVVGTGDLSEIALGWSTYNGDHMSMYAVNCSIPKTLIRFLIETTAERSVPELAAVLRDVIDTPVSPELLPASADGSINQKTEELIGPYELHDFFLYHFIKYGAEPEKIRALAGAAFAGVYDEETIERTLKIFLRRFFQQQFKRSCIPDGPKVGTIALSPRGDWRMPSDASDAIWRS